VNQIAFPREIVVSFGCACAVDAQFDNHCLGAAYPVVLAPARAVCAPTPPSYGGVA
jgi:hypothetical protein